MAITSLSIYPADETTLHEFMRPSVPNVPTHMALIFVSSSATSEELAEKIADTSPKIR